MQLGSWSRPIRLLWIDGEPTYQGAKEEDFGLFSPYLSNGAIVAPHDALHGFEGPLRVFVEETGSLSRSPWPDSRRRVGAILRKSREVDGPLDQNQYDVMRCTSVRSATPVGPFAIHGLASSFQAVPAISR